MVICTDKGNREFSWTKDHFYLVDKPCEKRNPGYPLDSLQIVPEFGKYLAELSEEEKELYKKNERTDDVIGFILRSVQ